jgi:hypothetical protein
MSRAVVAGFAVVPAGLEGRKIESTLSHGISKIDRQTFIVDATVAVSLL